MELWFPRMELLFQESPFRIGDVTATISVSGSGQTISGNPVVVFVGAALAHERRYLDGPSPENLPRSKSAPRTGFSLTSFLAGPRDTTGPETSALPLRPRFNMAWQTIELSLSSRPRVIPGSVANAARAPSGCRSGCLRERIPMLSAMTLDQLGAKMKCDRCSKRPERYYPANQSAIRPGLFEGFRSGANDGQGD